MSRGKRICCNSYKYKFQIIVFLFLLISLLSSCGVVLDNVLPDFETQQNVEFNVYFQAFYSPTLKDICKEKLGGEFDIDNLEKVSVDIEINGQSAHFDDLLEGSNNITPQITIEKKKNASIIANSTVTYFLKKDEFIEATEVTLEYFYSFSELNLLDKEKVFLIFYLKDEDNKVTLSSDIFYDVKKYTKDIPSSSNQKIYYVVTGEHNDCFFSIYRNENVDGIFVDTKFDEDNVVYVFPNE